MPFGAIDSVLEAVIIDSVLLGSKCSLMPRVLLLMGVLAALPTVGFATKVIIKGGDPPPTLPIQDVNYVQPDCSNGMPGVTGFPPQPTCTYYFEDTTTSIVDSFTFEATITVSEESDFSCLPTITSGPDKGYDPNGYFKNCSVSFDPIAGSTNVELVYNYSGVNPPDGDEAPTDYPKNHGEIGEYEGIPPDGVFTIELEGWSGPLKSLTLNTSYVLAPEPSAAIILLTELLLGGCILALLGRKLNWKHRFNL
jgi:hypothetical protein